MSQFTTHLDIRPVDGLWVLTSPLVWEVRIGDFVSDTITVPVGACTDLGTIPWYARWLVNPADPNLAKVFALHDHILKAYGPDHQMFAAAQMHEALMAVQTKYRRLLVTAVVLGIDRW